MKDEKVVPLFPTLTLEERMRQQVAFLEQMAAMMAGDDSVKRAAFAFVLEMDDGSVVVQASGWADDARAQAYFLNFMRNHGWPQ